MRPYDLRTEYLENPLGLAFARPRFSWKLPARQVAYRIRVGSSPGDSDLWDSGVTASDRFSLVEYDGVPLESRKRAWWTVEVWDRQGAASLSQEAWFELGLAFEDWRAQWIGKAELWPKGVALRRTFPLKAKPASARLYASAKGIYVARINGRAVSADWFRPGWTDYRKRFASQTYDVAHLLKCGENVVEFTLGNGWYAGCLAHLGPQRYGTHPMLIAQLEMDDAIVSTDADWEYGLADVWENDLLMGQTIGPRGPLTSGVDVEELGEIPIEPQWGPSPRTLLRAPASIETRSGVTRIDLGKNMVGNLSFTATSPVTVRHAEILDANGKLYTTNLRSAKQEDHVTEPGLYKPEFTFHGFRYAEVDGPVENVQFHQICSTWGPGATFECSSPLVNQLWKNIETSWRGNSLEIPTDCPQRDERLGWTGDIQVFGRTATYLSDCASFLTKWLRDLRDSQDEDGWYCDVAPRVWDTPGAPAWADAGVILPWTLYQVYGDVRVLEDSLSSMVRYVEAIRRENPDGLWMNGRHNDYGDWLNVNDDTARPIIGTLYFARSAELLGRIAGVLGRVDETRDYAALALQIKRAFRRAFVDRDGRIKGDTQTAYVLALAFNMLGTKGRGLAEQHLVRRIEENGVALSTGFLGVGHLCPVLTKIGRIDLAYSLLLREEFPGWGYSIRHGATSIWERWDGWTEDKGFQDPGMNSFNHYALGAVGEWLMSTVAGIDAAAPGFARIRLAPQPGPGLDWVKASFQSPVGRIVSEWERTGKGFDFRYEVPAGVRAVLRQPH